MKLVKKLILLIVTLGISLAGFTVGNFQKYGQETAQLDSFNDWSDYGFDFKIAKPRYEENSKTLPRHISEQIEQDQQKNIKSFSQDALPFKYFDDQQRETFFWVKDEQIQNTKGEIIRWWDKDLKVSGKNIAITQEQTSKVKKALNYVKEKLIKQGWYQKNKSKFSWDFYKEHLGKFLTLEHVNDGDTMKFIGLKDLDLLETKDNASKAKNNNVRILVVDTDETFWMRYRNQKNKTSDKYLPTRLGYVQKAVAKIVNEIYQNQKWFVVPVENDIYSRTLSLIFTPDGIPWHKFLCEFYAAAIYNKDFQESQFRKRQNYLMAQWWMVDFWKDRAPVIPDPKDKDYQQTAPLLSISKAGNLIRNLNI